MTLEINGYNAEEFKKRLPTTPHYKKIQELLDKNQNKSFKFYGFIVMNNETKILNNSPSP